MRLVLLLSLVSCVAAVLRNLQVAEPPDTRSLTLLCSVELLTHTFANSYGRPAKAIYKPSKACGEPATSWSRLVLNFTATSRGRQYDRLSTLYLGHVEIARISTAEPTSDGIIWTVLKDVSRYHQLFSKEGPLLLDLGNLLDPSVNLTGVFNVTLSLDVYGGGKTLQRDLTILPLSSRSLEQANYFDSTGSVEILAPFNAVEAFVELYVSGNALEEFWYANAPDEVVQYMPEGAGIVAKGPFREVQLWIDDKLAGFVTPFPVIYTGGIIPTAWRPVAAYGAFDAPTYILDITPFLALLCDDSLHTFTLKTVGQVAEGAINANWWVSGHVRFVLGTTQTRTTGRILSHKAQERPQTAVVVKVPSDREIWSRVTTLRTLRTKAELIIDNDNAKLVEVAHETSLVNHQQYRRGATEQEVWQQISTDSLSVHDGETRLVDKASYLLSTTTKWDSGLLRLDAQIDQSFARKQILPQRAFAGFAPQSIVTHQHATGFIQLNSTTGRVSNGTGETSQSFSFDQLDRRKWKRGTSYWRNIESSGGRVVRDNEGGPLARQAFTFTTQLSHERRLLKATETDVLPPRWLKRIFAVH